MPIRFIALAAAVLVASAPASASPVFSVVESWGSLLIEAWADSSPTPGCWTTWERTTADPPHFHDTVLEPALPCGETWLVHCDTDSLALHAAWPDATPGEPDPLFFRSVGLTAELACRIQVAEGGRFEAVRSYLGLMDIEQYGVTVTLPDGSASVLLDPAGGADVAELAVAPGEYVVMLTAYAYDDDRIPDFDLRLTVEFLADATPVAPLAWSSIRALFR